FIVSLVAFSFYVIELSDQREFNRFFIIEERAIRTEMYILTPIKKIVLNVTQNTPCYHYFMTPNDIKIGEAPVVYHWLIIFILSFPICFLYFAIKEEEGDY
ncbi:MAG: hypothetical protein AABY22_18140, partial [Nanoarchaeota archaeon]